jgi:hypothetical protein
MLKLLRTDLESALSFSQNGLLLCYDLTSRTSFEKLRSALYPLIVSGTSKLHASKPNKYHGLSSMALVVCGCKLDRAGSAPRPSAIEWKGSQRKRPRQVLRSEGAAFARSIGACGFFETSAADGRCVEDAFRALARDCWSREPYKHALSVDRSAVTGQRLAAHTRAKSATPQHSRWHSLMQFVFVTSLVLGLLSYLSRLCFFSSSNT